MHLRWMQNNDKKVNKTLKFNKGLHFECLLF